MVKESVEELAHPEYWNQRYSTQDDDAKAYDWLRNFDSIRPFLTTHLPPPETNPNILHLGSGNSTLPADLLSKANYTHQTAIDFSDVVINAMRPQHLRITWTTMDARTLLYPDSSWDVCIDKSTLDVMLYGSLWDPLDEVKVNVRAFVDEVARVLRPGGVWVCVSLKQPWFVRPLVSRPEVWDVLVETLSDGAGVFEYFGYVMRKKSTSISNVNLPSDKGLV